MVLTTSRGTSLGNLLQSLNTLIVNKILPKTESTLFLFKVIPPHPSIPFPDKEMESFLVVSTELSFLHAKQSEIAQPVLTGEEFQASDHLCGLFWTHLSRSKSESYARGP